MAAHNTILRTSPTLPWGCFFHCGKATTHSERLVSARQADGTAPFPTPTAECVHACRMRSHFNETHSVTSDLSHVSPQVFRISSAGLGKALSSLRKLALRFPIDFLDRKAKRLLAFLMSLPYLIYHYVSHVPSEPVDRSRIAVTAVLRAAVATNGSFVFNSCAFKTKPFFTLSTIATAAILFTEFAKSNVALTGQVLAACTLSKFCQ